MIILISFSMTYAEEGCSRSVFARQSKDMYFQVSEVIRSNKCLRPIPARKGVSMSIHRIIPYWEKGDAGVQERDKSMNLK